MGWSRRIKKIKEYFSDENQPNLDVSKLSEDNKKKLLFLIGLKNKKNLINLLL